MDTKAAQKQLVGLITQHLSESIPVSRILTYKPDKNGSVTGRFESLNRVFNFVFNGDDVRYKPAMNADSALFSKYYLQRLDAAPATPKGSKALPKCTAISYSCKGEKGVRCLPLTQNCKIGTDAIGKERLNKIKVLSKSLAASGEDNSKIEAARAKLVEQRMKLAVENRVKRSGQPPNKVEEKVKVLKPKKTKAAKAASKDYQFKTWDEARKNLQELGSGIEGTVYRDGNAAVKYLQPPRTVDQKSLDRMIRSGELGVSPKILGVSKDRTMVAMELVDGVIGGSGAKPKSPEQKNESESLLKKIKILDDNKLMHDDLHGENIMYDKKTKEIMLIDSDPDVASAKDRAGLIFGRGNSAGRPMISETIDSYLRDFGDKKSKKAFEKLRIQWDNDENPEMASFSSKKAKPVVRDDAYYDKMKNDVFALLPFLNK
jgi:hypothetical protein